MIDSDCSSTRSALSTATTGTRAPTARAKTRDTIENAAPNEISSGSAPSVVSRISKMPRFLLAIRLEPRNRNTGTSGSRVVTTALRTVVFPIPIAPITNTPPALGSERLAAMSAISDCRTTIEPTAEERNTTGEVISSHLCTQPHSIPHWNPWSRHHEDTTSASQHSTVRSRIGRECGSHQSSHGIRRGRRLCQHTTLHGARHSSRIRHRTRRDPHTAFRQRHSRLGIGQSSVHFSQRLHFERLRGSSLFHALYVVDKFDHSSAASRSITQIIGPRRQFGPAHRCNVKNLLHAK